MAEIQSPVVSNDEDTGAKTVPPTLVGRNIKEQLADAFTFIRSVEANKALSAVTLEELVQDHIKRNGDTDKTNATQYNPYAYNTNETMVASQIPRDPANFLGASDTGGPSKIARIQAIRNGIEQLIDGIKLIDPRQLAGSKSYGPAGDTDLPATQ